MSNWNRSASCLLIIGNISSSWGGCEYNLLHHRTRISSLGAVASALFVDSMCVFHFYREKTGREADLRFNLWTRWKANTDVRSEKQFQLTSERSLQRWAVMVLADGFLSLPLCYGWHSQGPWLVKILHLKIVCCEISPFRFFYFTFFFFLPLGAWKSYSTTGCRDTRNNWCVACA